MEAASGKTNFPYEIKNLSSEIQKKITKHFVTQADKLVLIGPEKWLMPEKFRKFADEIYNFKARPTDVFISTFPRSGTTWTQEMIWLICNDLDYEKASKISLSKRFPFLEYVIREN